MVLFFILAGLLTLLAAGLLAWPLLRPMAAPAEAAEHGQAVYRDQLLELDRDVARGILSAQEEQAARAEIGRRMLAAGRSVSPRRGASAAPMRVLAVLAVLFPLAGVALYATLGQPAARDMPLAARLAAGETRETACTAELEGAIAELSQQLRQDPDNFETRLTIARVLTNCGRFADALEHFEAALALTEGGDNIEVRSEYAQARVVAADGYVDNEAFGLFREVIEADPDNVEARLFLGLALAQNQQFATARLLWEDLLADSPADAPWVPSIRQQLASMPTENGPLPGAQAPAIAIPAPGVPDAPASDAPASDAPPPDAPPATPQ